MYELSRGTKKVTVEEVAVSLGTTVHTVYMYLALRQSTLHFTCTC